MMISAELIDELVNNYQSPEKLFLGKRAIEALTKAVLERCPQGEMTLLAAFLPEVYENEKNISYAHCCLCAVGL